MQYLRRAKRLKNEKRKKTGNARRLKEKKSSKRRLVFN